MVVGVDVTAMGERNTGTSRFINCLLAQLNTTGNEIKSFPPNPLRNLSQVSKLKSIPFIKRGGMGRHLYRIFEQSKEMNKADVDIGIFPNYLMPLDFQKPSVIVIHDLSFFSNPQFFSKAFVLFYKDQLKRILKHNPIIATVSEYSKESIVKYLGVARDKVYLLQPYVDPDIFTRNESCKVIETEAPYFLYVGHIEPRKNLSFLIRNFIRWKTEKRINIRLKIVGELWLNSDEVQKLLKQYEHHPDIDFTGYVEEDQLHRLYSNAAGFVHSSIIEGFGFPVLEAMYYNLPVLCSSGTSTEEISKSYSVNINPFNDTDIIRGFDILLAKSLDVTDNTYEIKYSPQLMQTQLNLILEVLTGKKEKIFYINNTSQNEIETAVEKTLLYYKLFNSGVNFDHLHTFLFDLKVTRHKLNETLLSLIEKNIVCLNDNVLTLNADIYPIYAKRNKTLDNKVIKRSLNMLNKIPFITSIAFSGGTANYGLGNHDDIDLFIITKPFTVYIVYIILHLISVLLKSRNIICMNYLIDENAVKIDIQHDLYTAHQIVMLKAFKNEKYLKYFFYKNKWVNEFYPNYNIAEYKTYKRSIIYYFYRPFNFLIKNLYRYYYRKHIRSSEDSSIVLSEKVIKLHTRDYRRKILDEFEAQWLKYRQNKSKISTTQLIAK